MQGGPASFPGAPLGGIPLPFGVNSPVQPFQQHHQPLPPRLHTPPLNGSFPPRPVSLPAAPGLPQRPAFGAPQVNAFQMQQMHQGQIPGPPNPPINQSFPRQDLLHNTFQQHPAPVGPPSSVPRESANATSLDDLISGASQQAEANSRVQAEPTPPSQSVEEPAEEKAAKKDKDKSKPLVMVYSDNDVSPEEKMARMPRYAYTPEKRAVLA